MSTHSGVLSRLFLSADLVGSTARKQVQGSPTWIGDVLAFYQQFPSHLAAKINEVVAEKQAKINDFELSERPTLWKAVGDELIYTADVKDEHDICVLIDAWIRAMRATETAVLDKPRVDLKGMDLKGAAWIATFPCPDRAVAVPNDPGAYESDFDPNVDPEVVNRQLLELYDGGDRTSVRVDYLGPSVDIGFRVASRSITRKFVLCFEVAWAVAVSRQTARDATPMYYDGEVELKGVWGGRGYPLFWLDTGNHHTARKILDDIGKLTKVTPEQVRDLAEALHDAGDWPSKLHLPRSRHPEFQRDFAAIADESARPNKINDLSVSVPDLSGDGA